MTMTMNTFLSFLLLLGLGTTKVSAQFGSIYDDPELNELHQGRFLDHVGPQPLTAQHLKVTVPGIPVSHRKLVDLNESNAPRRRHERHRKLLETIGEMVGTDEVDLLLEVKNEKAVKKVKQLGDLGEDLLLGTSEEVDTATIQVVSAKLKVDKVKEIMDDPDFASDFGFIEPDSEGFMSGWVDEIVGSEWETYGIRITQGNSQRINSTNTFGDCSDPSSFKVAIIDSGLKVDHPDVPCQTTANGKTNCMGASFGTTDPWDKPVQAWHGTHVFGPMGAIGGNDAGVTSMNPTNNNICWLVGRTFPDAGGPAKFSHIYAAVNWALDNGAKVINMSLSGGFTETGQAVFNKAKSKGAIVVAAAGNSFNWQYEYPSSYKNVISVGAIGSNKKWAKFSTCNFDLNLAGPGVSVWSLDTQSRNLEYGPYRYASGTSMATPFVAGAIAKIWAPCQECSEAQVTDCIFKTAETDGEYSWCYGNGLIQAESAYDCLKEEGCC